MISYAPLAETLEEKGIGFDELEDMLGTERGDLKWRMNEGRYISMRTLDKICEALGCEVDGVVEWRKGRQESVKMDRFVYVDWDKFREDAGDLYEAAERTGRSRTCIVMMAKRERVGRALFRKLCASLGLEHGKYVKR